MKYEILQGQYADFLNSISHYAASFRAPFAGIQLGETADLFVPITMKAQMTPNSDGLTDHKDYWLAMIGRLKPGLSPAQAEEAFAPLYRQILETELPLAAARFSPEAQQRFLEKRMLMEPGSRGRAILQRDVKQPLSARRDLLVRK